MRNSAALRCAFAAIAACAGAAAHAAGGHFSVDDATILDPGQWEQETWYSRAGGGTNLLHAGLNFRVGPVELDGALERARSSGDPAATNWNLEMKWAHPLTEHVGIGFDVQPAGLLSPVSQYAVTRFYGILSWQAHDTLLLNVNAGHDWVRGGSDLPRGGFSAEWTPVKVLTLIAERYLDTGTHFVRGGVRWSPTPRWTWDISRAQRLSGPAPSTWTLGIDYHSP